MTRFTPTAMDIVRIVRERILADMRASDAYCNPQTRKIAFVTLESLARNLALEFSRCGLAIGSELAHLIMVEQPS